MPAKGWSAKYKYNYASKIKWRRQITEIGGSPHL